MTVGAEVRTLVKAIPGITEVYRTGYVPDGAVSPYADFLDPLSNAVALEGDGETKARRRLIQLNLWQREATENVDLIETLTDALDGAKTASGHRLRVLDVNRLPEDDDWVHHAVTLSVPRVG